MRVMRMVGMSMIWIFAQKLLMKRINALDQ